MAATIKTLIEKAEARKKSLLADEKSHEEFYELLSSKIVDLEIKHAEVGSQLTRLRYMRDAHDNRDADWLESELDALKETA